MNQIKIIIPIIIFIGIIVILIENVINRSKEVYKNSRNNTLEHFTNISKLSKRVNNASVEIKDYYLSRYACYLIIQNGI